MDITNPATGYPEPIHSLNGKPLNTAQAMALRVAVESFAMSLDDPEHMEALGAIGPLYKARIEELRVIIYGE